MSAKNQRRSRCVKQRGAAVRFSVRRALFSMSAKSQRRSRCVKQRGAAVRFSVRRAFFKGCKKSVAESVRKTKVRGGAFLGPLALFQKALKIIGLGRFFRPERRPLQTLRPIIYRPARAYCQRMLSSRRAFRIATGGPNAPRHSRICATPWIGAGR